VCSKLRERKGPYKWGNWAILQETGLTSSTGVDQQRTASLRVTARGIRRKKLTFTNKSPDRSSARNDSRAQLKPQLASGGHRPGNSATLHKNKHKQKKQRAGGRGKVNFCKGYPQLGRGRGRSLLLPSGNERKDRGVSVI